MAPTERRKARELIPARIRARLIDRAQAAVNRLGYQIEPHDHGLTPEEGRRARLLASLGVTVILDVGANAGQYARSLRRIGYEGRIVSFEPLPDAFERLARAAREDPRWECRRVALGAVDSVAEINVSANSFSSSILRMRQRHLESAPESEYVGTETVEVKAIDPLWPDVVGPDDVVYLKLDVQGFEMEVLRGARASVPKLAAIQVEVSLVPLYVGAPAFGEVLDHLSANGFRPAGFEGGYADRTTGELLQADCIFVRDQAI